MTPQTPLVRLRWMPLFSRNQWRLGWKPAQFRWMFGDVSGSDPTKSSEMWTTFLLFLSIPAQSKVLSILHVHSIWVNYNDLTTTSLEIMVTKGNHPLLWPQDSGLWNIIIYPDLPRFHCPKSDSSKWDWPPGPLRQGPCATRGGERLRSSPGDPADGWRLER